jgi:hypothetical protein
VRRVWLTALVLRLGSAGLPLPAQVADTCRPGNPANPSNPPDWSPKVCTRRPTPIETNLRATVPQWINSSHASVLLVLRTDGTVDQDRTRLWSAGGLAEVAHGFSLADTMMAVLPRLRFTPALVGDSAVRSALDLEITTPGAPDSVPAVPAWRYVMGPQGQDTLYLDWALEAPLPLGNPEEVSQALAVAVAELRTKPVFVFRGRDGPLWTGCSVIGKDVPNATAIASRLASMGVPLHGQGRCAAYPQGLAAVWTRAFRIGPSLYVFRFTGPNMTGRCRVSRGNGGWIAGC